MGTVERRKREKERRKQQILVAARNVLSRSGGRSPFMKEVAEEAELSIGTIYLYYSTKEDLIAALSLQMFRFLLMRLEHIKQDTQSAGFHGKMQALRRSMFEVYQTDPLLFNHLLNIQLKTNQQTLSPAVQSEWAESARTYRDRIAAYLTDPRAPRGMSKKDATTMADILWAIFTGLILCEGSDKPPYPGDYDFSLNGVLDRAFTMVADGVKSGKPENS